MTSKPIPPPLPRGRPRGPRTEYASATQAVTGATHRKERSENATAFVVVQVARRDGAGNPRPTTGLHRFYLARADHDHPGSKQSYPLRIAKGPTTWHRSVEEAREEIPSGLRRHPREDADAEWIVETWI